MIEFFFNNFIDQSATVHDSPLDRDERWLLWTGSGATAYTNITLPATTTQSFDAVLVLDHNVRDGGYIKVEVWTDALGGASKVEDVTVYPYADYSGQYGGRLLSDMLPSVTPYWRSLTKIPLSQARQASTNRYVRVTLATNGPTASLSRIYVGPTFKPSFGHDYGLGFGLEELRRPLKTPAGQEYVNPSANPRAIDLTLSWVNGSDREAFYANWLYHGTHKPFFVLPYPDSAKEQAQFGLYAKFKRQASQITATQYDRLPVRLVESL